MNIALCGATGFIGKNLLLALSKIPDIHIFAFWHRKPPFHASNSVTWIKCDFQDPSSFLGCFDHVDLVLQFAAVTSGAKDIVESPYLHVTSNAIINSNILHELSRSLNSSAKHLIFPSCSIVYPSSSTPVAENRVDHTGIHDVYFGAAHTKLYIEKQIEFFARNNCFTATILRHSNLYGPHDKYFSEQGHVLASAFSKILRSTSTVEIWGDGSSLRDLLYIDDFIDLIKLFLHNQHEPFHIYNCGSGHLVSVKNIYTYISKVLGRPCNFVFDTAKPSFDFTVLLDSSKIKDRLGWEASTPLLQGLRLTSDWLNSLTDSHSLDD